MKKSTILISGVALSQCISAGVLAQNIQNQDMQIIESMTNESSIVEFYGSVGIIGIESREHVYTAPGSSDNLSLLIWQSAAPLLTAGFDVKLPEDWTFNAELQVATSGASYMEDYDWLQPHFISYNQDDWTHRSQHQNTNLDWYFNGSMALGKDFAVSESTTVNLKSGFKYVDVQWTASGGTGTYSYGAFRDTDLVFPDTPGITYRQQLPSVFVGLDTQMVEGDWTVDFGVQAGVTFMAKATDRHWLRTPPLRFEDFIVPSPTLAMSAGLSYEVSDGLKFFVDGNLEKVILGRGDVVIYENYTDVLLNSFPDTAGAELISASLAIGLKGEF